MAHFGQIPEQSSHTRSLSDDFRRDELIRIIADGGITCVDKLEELLNKLSVCIHILNRYKNENY